MTSTYYVAIPTAHLKAAPLEVVLDMLRYDQSQVVEERGGHTILRAAQPHTVDRWRSFGIVPATDGHTALDVWEIARDIAQTERRTARATS